MVRALFAHPLEVRAASTADLRLSVQLRSAHRTIISPVDQCSVDRPERPEEQAQKKSPPRIVFLCTNLQPNDTEQNCGDDENGKYFHGVWSRNQRKARSPAIIHWRHEDPVFSAAQYRLTLCPVVQRVAFRQQCPGPTSVSEVLWTRGGRRAAFHTAMSISRGMGTLRPEQTKPVGSFGYSL